jgi:phosphoglycolate phosphatase
MTKLAVFDCDGTLVDSGATIHRALYSTMSEHGLDCPPRHVAQKVIGLSLDEAMLLLAPGSDPAGLSATYRRTFQGMRAEGAVAEPLFDGIMGLIDALEAAGWLLGVATGKSDRGLGLCLAEHGLADRFVTLQTADRHPSKPDMGCAVNAGAGAIGAAWGYHSAEELAGAGAYGVAMSPADVPGLARQWREPRS